MQDPARRPARLGRDEALSGHVQRVWSENFEVYGVRKVWRQLRREGFDVARCTIERLMRRLRLRGVVRGKTPCTTVSDRAMPCPQDHVNRQFQASRPNSLRVSDFTDVSTWQGFVYVALILEYEPQCARLRALLLYIGQLRRSTHPILREYRELLALAGG